MAKDRRSRDQKRRDKLAKKARKTRTVESWALTGNKYRSEELIPTWFQAEIGIYEAYVITDKTLLDQAAYSAVETLAKQMRAGTLPPLPDTSEIEYTDGEEADLVVLNIRRRWAWHYENKWKPPREKRIGVLRTILGSIETMRSTSPRSQSYMHHIAGFLTKQLGVSVKRVTADMEPLPEPEEDQLVQLGRLWTEDGNRDARADFHELAGELMREGQADDVINACHQLLSEVPDPASEVGADLTALSMQARQALIVSMG